VGSDARTTVNVLTVDVSITGLAIDRQSRGARHVRARGPSFNPSGCTEWRLAIRQDAHT
jgi:hypothetical protein